MALVKDILYRFRWLILSGCSLVMFSLIVILGIAVLELETSSVAEQSQTPQPSLYPSDKPVDTDESTPFQEATSTLPPITETIKIETPMKEIAYVQQVIDGDSIEVILDGAAYDLRYIGIDAPETGMPLSREATEANRRLVEGQIVELEQDVSNTDQYGRLLRYVYLLDGTLVNAELVKLGLAAAIAYPPDILHQEIINASEREAVEGGIGLWAPIMTPTLESNLDPSEYIQVEPNCSQFNAPGNDNHNKNEEFVCIVNTGPEIVEMESWSIHDEYGWSYQFPSFSLESGAKVKVITGCGSDTAQDLYWCKEETAVWNNDGDCVYLINIDGIEVTKYCY